MEGISFAAWERSIFELRQNNRAVASLSQGVIDRAIKRIKEVDAHQCALRQLGPIGDTYEQIKRAQRETFWGLSLGSNPELPAVLPQEDREDAQGLLSSEILMDQTPLSSLSPASSDDEDAPIEFWSFSDDADDQAQSLTDESNEEKSND